ncbi:F-box/WD repeat-containing protein 15-like [Lethenteron reissneri]|uniref:F-box/WD repeat-containing protein 15-like n=1 Tax=Lethenteron reissneri TaxID=7753 RepID=UPI002AB5FD94|nr:F-box/WD repeat-containing protein 15-like [Lethenteron reissneri]
MTPLELVVVAVAAAAAASPSRAKGDGRQLRSNEAPPPLPPRDPADILESLTQPGPPEEGFLAPQGASRRFESYPRRSRAAMECEQQQPLPFDCLAHVFTFLRAEQLLRAAVVNRLWNAVANSPALWRCLCRRRWAFCRVERASEWKRYYLRRQGLERALGCGRPGADYTCTTLRGHDGAISAVCYLSDGEPRIDTAQGDDDYDDDYDDDGQENAERGKSGASASRPEKARPLTCVCSASKDGSVRAWDVHTGQQLWLAGQVGGTAVECLVAVPTLGLVVSGSRAGEVTVWDAAGGHEVATRADPTPGVTVLATCALEGGHFLLAGGNMGTLRVLALPSLAPVRSLLLAEDHALNLLAPAPVGTVILVGATHSPDVPVQLLGVRALCTEDEEEAPPDPRRPLPPRPANWRPDPMAAMVTATLPELAGLGVLAAAWFPAKPARLAAAVELADGQHEVRCFDVELGKARRKEHVAVSEVAVRFIIPKEQWATQAPFLRTASHNIVLTTLGQQLSVWDAATGGRLATFSDHKQQITGIHVDPFRVVSCSLDLSLRVYTWAQAEAAEGMEAAAGAGQQLVSKYTLLGGSLTCSRGFRNVVSDCSSVVGVVQANNGRDVLKAYNFGL